MLRKVIIESSKDNKKAGEYVIDVAEYYSPSESTPESITYFQLKHSTKRYKEPFLTSDLKDTIQGFAKRFSAHLNDNTTTAHSRLIKFSIVTNRLISENLKDGINAIKTGSTTTKKFQNILEKYTNLTGTSLRDFCSAIEFVDCEGDYNVQRDELKIEMSEFLAEPVATAQLDTIIALVQDHALPDKNGHIVREDILQRFGVTSERDLFPAPSVFEENKDFIKREQHDVFFSEIINANEPIIIHAGGGVGKSVVCRQLSEGLPVGSLGFIYDCFGAGKYRNPSERRHRHRDAIVQISNEMSSYGLCEPLIPRSNDLDDSYLNAFCNRIKNAVSCLRSSTPDAIIVVFIDAADNAEMAAIEQNESCFANQLLRLDIPIGCRIVLLCRTERIGLLDPPSTIKQLHLSPFSSAETFEYVKSIFPTVTPIDGSEFHKLTGGNPRVLANALTIKGIKVPGALTSLGLSGTTVDSQISSQLGLAVSKIKDSLPKIERKNIEAICLGLANLPPFIPIPVLAKAAEVAESAIKSFVADLGRPLWASDDSVQFRDEPTETWFREKFSASSQQIESYVKLISPLASTFSYVAEVMPALLLISGNYDELVRLATSDECLPENNPIDKHNIRISRLQFAFKAALKQKKYADAVKLALRAGEEVAGNSRQIDILTKNVDLVALLQTPQNVQDLAFRRILHGTWTGSGNVYSAALLSYIVDFKGEARSYLRAADNWLHKYFKERRNAKDKFASEKLHDNHIVEMATAHYNLLGAEHSVNYILSWTPLTVGFKITKQFIARLIDAGKFEEIIEISSFANKSQYMIIAITDELLAVGKFLPARLLQTCLNLLSNAKKRVVKESQFDENITSAIVSFAEACLKVGLSREKILKIIKHYVNERACNSVTSDYQEELRRLFMRSVAIKAVISGNYEPDISNMLPDLLVKRNNDYDKEEELKEFKRIVELLLPWYFVRAHVLAINEENLDDIIQNASQRSKKGEANYWREYDRIPYEIARVRFEILTFRTSIPANELSILKKQLPDKEYYKFTLKDRLYSLRSAYRVDHLSEIRNLFENLCSATIDSINDERPETKAQYYIDLARAVLSEKREDAVAYFAHAYEAISKFGDEIVKRWEALVALAKRSAGRQQTSQETIYRFIRCSELIRDNIDFDHSGSIEACVELCPAAAFAALSRWRDRDVGCFDRQLFLLARAVVDSGVISPSIAWAFSAFSLENNFEQFLELCIAKEPDIARRKYMFDATIREFQLVNTAEERWLKINDIAQKFLLDNTDMKNALAFYSGRKKDIKKNQPARLKHKKRHIDWEKIFNGLDLTESIGVYNAYARFKTISDIHEFELFWQQFFKRVPEENACSILRTIAEVKDIDIYDMQYALSEFPDSWKQKASVKKDWGSILEYVARRFAKRLSNIYNYQEFSKLYKNDETILAVIHNGIINGLAGSSDLMNASSFFDFANIFATSLSSEDATLLLDFGLTRFEKHIDINYADGLWGNWLLPPENVTDALAGLIWSALGSPRASMRWNAAHCVRRIAEVGGTKEIDALIGWMVRDKINAFGSKKFPFYNLHAKQYLLITLNRIAIDCPSILRIHSNIFVNLALKNVQHILIQKYARDIALSIESAFPGTYDELSVKRLRQIGVSQLPVKEISGHNIIQDSPWPSSGNFNFAYDFDRYWFRPLGEVFGISKSQVEDLAQNVVLGDWNVNQEGSYLADPRAELWQKNRCGRETSHSHNSYPLTDDYRFYLSYHAIFVVASKLLIEMPVVHSESSWYNDEWLKWLKSHSLTRDDGKWLADRRDPIPHQYLPGKNQNIDDWLKPVSSAEFMEILLFDRNNNTWLNIHGHWNENDSMYCKSVSISSALVSPEVSESLLNTMNTYTNPYEFYLPDFEEERREIRNTPFILKSLIGNNESQERSIDDLDPHAGKIYYPPITVNNEFIKRFRMSADLEQRGWYLPQDKYASIVNEIWSTGQQHELLEDPIDQGNTLSASLDFLKKLCVEFKSELVIKVQVKHEMNRKYYKRSYDEEYKPPCFKVYLLSANGKLRDSEKSYQLR